MNFLVRAVAFSVERVDEGAITVDDPATFQGEGLPGSLVIVRFAEGNANSTQPVYCPMAPGAWTSRAGNWELKASLR